PSSEATDPARSQNQDRRWQPHGIGLRLNDQRQTPHLAYREMLEWPSQSLAVPQSKPSDSSPGEEQQCPRPPVPCPPLWDTRSPPSPPSGGTDAKRLFVLPIRPQSRRIWPSPAMQIAEWKAARWGSGGVGQSEHLGIAGIFEGTDALGAHVMGDEGEEVLAR